MLDDTDKETLLHRVVTAGAYHQPCIRVRWAVLATYPQAERWALQNLTSRGYVAYLPMFATMQRDRVLKTMKHLVHKPLWPGYVFVQHTPGSPWRAIRYCPGIRANLIGGKGICYAPDAAVEAVQATDAQRMLPHEPSAAWAPGTPVALSGGVLDGVHGVVLKVGQDMALVSLLMLGQLREVSVNLDCLSVRDD